MKQNLFRLHKNPASEFLEFPLKILRGNVRK